MSPYQKVEARAALEKLIGRYTFSGAFSLLHPRFIVEVEGIDLRVDMYLTVPDRIDPSIEKEIKAQHRFPVWQSGGPGYTEKYYKEEFVNWVNQYWEHEFWESIKFDDKFVKNQH